MSQWQLEAQAIPCAAVSTSRGRQGRAIRCTSVLHWTASIRRPETPACERPHAGGGSRLVDTDRPNQLGARADRRGAIFLRRRLDLQYLDRVLLL